MEKKDIHPFVAGMARAEYSASDFFLAAEKAFWKGCFSKKQVYEIIKLVKDGADTTSRLGHHEHPKVRTDDAIPLVENTLDEDRRLGVNDIVGETGLARSTGFRILKEDLGLVKKSCAS